MASELSYLTHESHSFFLAPCFPQTNQPCPLHLIHRLALSHCLFDPTLSLIGHHNHTVLVLTPRFIAACEGDPHLCMPITHVLEPLMWKSELHDTEQKVDIDPVVRLLVERRMRKGVTYVENIAVEAFGRMRSDLLAESVYRCCPACSVHSQ